MGEDLRFDHVILGVGDLDAAAARLWEQYGLRASGGGVHPGGTKNLGAGFSDRSYLELLAVNDPSLPLGAWLSGRIAGGDGLVGWAVGTEDIAAVAARLGQQVTEGSIGMPDGSVGRWHITGLAMDGVRPFFIQYERNPDAEARMQQTAADPANRHRVDTLGITWVEVSGDETAMKEWLGGADLNVRFVEGEPGLRAVGIRTADGEIAVR